MRISEVILSGFIIGMLARHSCCSNATDFGGGVDDFRNDTLSVMPGGGERSLSRKRRFIAFPVGSSFSVAVCMTIGVIGNPNYMYLSLGLNWGLAYNLPNSSWVLEHAHGLGKKTETPEPVVKRRYRRELYQRVELIMDRCNSYTVEIASICYLKMFFQIGCLIHLGVLSMVKVGLAHDDISTTFLHSGDVELSEQQRKHHRSRRYVAFPEGSSFTCAVCATVGVVGSPSFDYLSYGLNWGVAYDLPNETWILNHLHGFGSKSEPAAVIRRRHRRSLYLSIENTVDSMGYNGRDCILRSLCESRQFFKSEKLGMIPELLRSIFSLPKTRLFTRELRENSDIEHYNNAYFSDDYEDCEYKYPCSFSLLELAMGKYSQPQSDYYGD